MKIENLKNKINIKIIKKGLDFIWSYVIFLAVLFIYVIRGLLRRLTKIKLLGKFFLLIKVDLLAKKLGDFMYWLDKNEDGGVTRSYLIELAFRNMKAKKNRAIVTIGGVAVGVGAIVFLVSVGYGLEKLVIGRVAKLDELKMADVSLGQLSAVKLNNDSVNKIKAITNVSDVVPVVSMVSKVRFNNSVLDVMSFGATEKYIQAVNPVFIEGEKFKDKDLDFVYSNKKNDSVLGDSQEVTWINKNETIDKSIFDFNINDGEKIPVWEECNVSSEFLGYALRSEGGYTGEFVWGESYLIKDAKEIFMDEMTKMEVSKWVKAKVPLWSVSSDGLSTPRLDGNGQQIWKIVCFKPENILINKDDGRYNGLSFDEVLSSGQVLGEATESADLVVTNISSSSGSLVNEATESAELFGGEVVKDESGNEWVQFTNLADDPNKLKEISFLGNVVGEAYVSTGMLKLLGISNKDSLGKSFLVSYIVSDGSIEGVTGRLQSVEVEYKIKGVIDDETSNYYYYQLADARRLGISTYSQFKVLVNNKENLSDVRKQIEGMGFKTSSTADTVAQIESLFKTLRFILAALGTIALAVASLGMFNTMTVSLLERTREVGVMKSMGMLSSEVSELFLAESMIMGVGGGVLGLMFGFGLGKILALILTSISVFKGQGAIDITYIPWFFTFFILLISFLVGMVTGWYPSKRARQVSALNALRYE